MSDAPGGPDTRRALLAVVCVLGLVVASTAAPALANQAPLGGLDSPPRPSDVPDFVRNLPGVEHFIGDTDPRTDLEFGTSAFGALTPGDSTDVGGAVSPEQQRDAKSPHFVAETSDSTYWRTGAYTTYTGSGWTRENVNRVQPPRPPHSRPTHWASVTLRKTATNLPTPWRPVDLNLECGEEIPCNQEFSLSQTSDIESSPPLEAGATYRVQSVDPVDDPAVLRDVRVAGSVVSTEYTTVETTDRVREVAAEVTSDADNRYDAAKAVETYLESEKTYSLTDVPEPGEHIADQFLFEQSAGYCEYFATTMTVMLRAQDVPARYVVGYQGGESVGPDRYLVRGANAHAWVEVYFEDVGWVRFDPTPSDARSDAREDLHADDPDFRVSLNQSAVPGEDVLANVTTAGLPARGVTVLVNGDSVGTTNAAGEVTFTVPYAEEMNVTVVPASDSDTVALSRENASSASPAVTSGPTASGVPESSAAYGVPPPAFDIAGDTESDAAFVQQSDDENNTAQQSGDENNTTQQFDVRSDVRFSFDGDVEPGAERTLSVTVAGKPFADASVSIAGIDQGHTDGNGTIAVQIPADASGVIDVTATREALSETTTYPVDDLSVAVSPSLLAPLPGFDATAHVTAGGEPVADATVRVAGERIGTTDDDGTVRFEMPLARVPAVTADASGKQATTHVGWVLPSAAIAVLLVLAALAGLVTTARRRGVTLDAITAAVVTLANEAVAALVRALVGVADALDELATEFRAAAADGWRGVLAWLASLPGRLRLPRVSAVVASAVAAGRAATADDSTAEPVPSGQTAAEDSDPGRLRAVWQRFVGVVGVDRWETRTPGEVAREAVRRGFPERPVYGLTNAFRDAAYGDRSASSRLQSARRALASLRGTDSTDEGGESD
jgi:transglutaminase-like putative cysteine protease